LNLSVQTYGDVGNDEILFIHGFGQSRRLAISLISQLVPSGPSRARLLPIAMTIRRTWAKKRAKSIALAESTILEWNQDWARIS
jgi:hypothetical protein